MGSQPLLARSVTLPVPLSSLVGRDNEVELICASLRQRGIRLLTLTGPGGVGKTRLALEAATAMRIDFVDDVHFVEMASISEPDLVIQAIASYMGIREHGSDSLLSTLLDILSSKSLLLVLDNCEHIIGPCADLAERLLRACPGIRIIATSRQRLGVHGEMVWRVSPLAVPDPHRLSKPQQLATIEAVRLFVERGNALLPGFDVTEENGAAIAQICQQLDGIPLALELAAGWVTTLSPDQIANRLDDRFRLLSGTARMTAPRQQTLRNTLEWSYDLLRNDEQALFNRLAVFAGGFTLRAIEAVCAEDDIEGRDVLQSLARLVEASLVIAEDRHREKRYRLAETVRLYARERLVTNGEAERMYQRHAHHYLELAEAAEQHLWGRDLAEWLDRLEVEHDNLRVALRWTTGHGEAEMAQRLAAALCRFWRVRGHASEGLRWLESGLSWTTGASVPTRARALDAAGHLARDRSDYDAAENFYGRSLGLRRECGDHRGAALALNSLAVVAQFRGEYTHASALQQESLALFQQLGDEQGVALSLVSLATIAQLQGDTERATDLYQEALGLFRRLGDSRGIAASLNNLGNLASRRGDCGAARDLYEESLTLFHGLGDLHEVAACLSNLAGVSLAQGDQERAIVLCQDSLRIFATLGDKQGIAACLIVLAPLVAEQGELKRATILMAAEETISQSTGYTRAANQYLERDGILGRIRALLGVDNHAAAWDEGLAMPLNEVVACALAPCAAPSAVASTKDRTSALTRREREVAVLIAQGLTNRQIAEELYISERTADTHVEHILAKLGVRGRAQVAVWVVEHGLIATA